MLVRMRRASLAVSVCLLAVPLCGDAQADALNGLVQGINTDGFVAAALGDIAADLVYVTPHGVTYSYRASPDAPVTTLLIGVWTSVQEARSVFRVYVSGLSVPLTPQTIKAGDESSYASLPGVSSSLIFRRDNAMVQLTWRGDESRGKRLSRRMDELLTTDTSICPRGPTVPLPVVTMDAPEATVGAAPARVAYRVAGGLKVRTEATPTLHDAGVVFWEPKSAEPETVEALFASETNVIFTVRVAPRAREPDGEPGVTQLLWERGFRHPVLVPSTEGLVAFFVKPPTPAADGAASEVPYMRLPGIEWPLYYAEAKDAASLPVAAQPALRLPLGYPDMSYERLCMGAFGGRTLVAVPRHYSEVDADNEALIAQITPGESAGDWALDPQAALPQSLVGAPSQSDEVPAQMAEWFLWDTRTVLDCERLAFAARGGAQRLYLCGEDHLAETVWCTSSEDARVWQDPVVVARFKGWPAIAARADHVFVAYTDTGRFPYQNLWPDDLSGTREFDFWAGSGSLKCRLSMDGGKTWDDERTIDGADQAVSSALTWADKGMLWLVYVKSFTQREATALCLMRSSDAGKTWTEPQQITSGKWVDRDPCITIHEGHPVVAFSRCRAPRKETSIWLWEGKRGGF